MSRVVGVRLGAELQSKLEALCARTGQHRSDVMRQVLMVVSVEQLCQASQEWSRGDGADPLFKTFERTR